MPRGPASGCCQGASLVIRVNIRFCRLLWETSLLATALCTCPSWREISCACGIWMSNACMSNRRFPWISSLRIGFTLTSPPHWPGMRATARIDWNLSTASLQNSMSRERYIRADVIAEDQLVVYIVTKTNFNFPLSTITIHKISIWSRILSYVTAWLSHFNPVVCLFNRGEVCIIYVCCLEYKNMKAECMHD